MRSTSIHDAACEGDLQRVTELLASDPTRANLDDQHQWRPVFHAALHRRIDIVQALIDHGADLSAHDGYVMHYAGEVAGNKPVVELLVQYGALDAHTKPRTEGARQFICAVFLANEARVAAMLTQEPSLAAERYARGDTALHHACRNGDPAIVRALIDRGADVDALSDGRHFPLYCAAGHCHVETTALLLERGADRLLTFEDGTTISDWLQQYADHDPRYRQCLDLVERG